MNISFKYVVGLCLVVAGCAVLNDFQPMEPMDLFGFLLIWAGADLK